VEVGEEPGRDIEVILEEIALGKAELRPENLVEIGEMDVAAVDLDGGFVNIARNLARFGGAPRCRTGGWLTRTAGVL
jgi:hypothetical protein